MHTTHTCALTLPCVYVLTLVCCPLLPSPLSRSQLLVSDASHCLHRHFFARLLDQRCMQLRVVRRAMLAVGAEDWCTHVLLHLPAAECAWSATDCSSLQRARSAIPSLMPLAHSLSASSYSVRSSECSERMRRGASSILEEDVMLAVCTELLHGCVVGEGGDEGVTERPHCCALGGGIDAHSNERSTQRREMELRRRYVRVEN